MRAYPFSSFPLALVALLVYSVPWLPPELLPDPMPFPTSGANLHNPAPLADVHWWVPLISRIKFKAFCVGQNAEYGLAFVTSPACFLFQSHTRSLLLSVY